VSRPAPGTLGVLLMAHGTPANPSEIETFYTRIRHGKPPSPEQLADLVRRYDAIGGTSPLAQRTAAQVAGITAALETVAPGTFLVRFGAKHTHPFIEDAAAHLAEAGVRRVVGLVLTPHRASMGSDEYLDRAQRALASTPHQPSLVRVPQWYDAPGFAELLAERVRAALGRLHTADRTIVLFSAHSLPQRVVTAHDPYPDQVAASAAAVAMAAGLETAGVSWRVVWQSAGRTPEPWIGPDLLQVLRDIGAESRGAGVRTAVVVCPIGFVSDHLEVLYDVDVEAHGVAVAEGLELARTASFDADPRFCAIVAGVVARAAAAEVPGDVAGEVPGDVAGEVPGDVAGEVADAAEDGGPR
jgi:ferrochelatase